MTETETSAILNRLAYIDATLRDLDHIRASGSKSEGPSDLEWAQFMERSGIKRSRTRSQRKHRDASTSASSGDRSSDIDDSVGHYEGRRGAVVDDRCM